MARKPSTRRLSLKDEALHPQATQQLPLGRPAQARVRKCELTFPDGIVSVVKGADNIWRCPRCKQEFGADARSLKEHARSGACMARARGGAVRQRRASGVRLRIGPLRTGDSAGDIEFIARRTRSDGPDDEADEDAFDMNEVLMKLEDENENENYCGNGDGSGSGSGSGMDQDRAPGEAEHTAMAIDPLQRLPDLAAEPAHDVRPTTPTPAQATRIASMGMQKFAAETAGITDAAEQKASSEADGRATTDVTVGPATSAPDSGEGAAADCSPRIRSVTAEATNANAAAALILLASPPQAAIFPNVPAGPPVTEAAASATSTSIPPPSPTTVALPSSPATRISRTTHPTEYSSAVPPALRGFLDTLLATGDFLPEIFMQREFDSAVALDLLCESAQEEEYHWLIQAIQARSHLVSLAVKRGLREREAALRAARAAAASE